jgi:hypothetical protein
MSDVCLRRNEGELGEGLPFVVWVPRYSETGLSCCGDHLVRILGLEVSTVNWMMALFPIIHE